MVTRCSLSVLAALWLTLAAAAAARRISIEYDVVPYSRPEDDVTEYLEEPVFGFRRLQDMVPYQPRVERPQFYRLGRIQKPMKRYLGVEIPDEIAQRNAGGGGGALIDRLKQQMQNSGK